MVGSGVRCRGNKNRASILILVQSMLHSTNTSTLSSQELDSTSRKHRAIINSTPMAHVNFYVGPPDHKPKNIKFPDIDIDFEN